MHRHATPVEQLHPSIISRERLQNGADLVFLDRSRRIAGDRWNVRLCAEVFIPRDLCLVPLQRLPSDATGKEGATEWVGEGLTVSFHKERHFVSDQEVESTLQGCGKELRETVLPYLQSQSFIVGAVTRLCRERVEKGRLAAMFTDATHETREAADPEPVDFSACFR